MILSDRDIKKQLADGRITVKPEPDFDVQLGSTSLDLKLGAQFRVFKPTSTPFIDPQDPKTQNTHTTVVDLNSKEEQQPLLPHSPNGPRGFVLHPGEFVLGVTEEYIELPDDIAGRLEGRSSLGRLGIVIHSTAGHFDPGFQGNVVLEITNIGVIPILLYPGMRFCQMVFEKVSSAVEVEYSRKASAKYVRQREPKGSQIGRDMETVAPKAAKKGLKKLATRKPKKATLR
ncbi:MAG: dCTP deaminase [bacterium]|nr:dCTP deaminase [bacterium]MDZ4248114.1 dCTP deaminase [Patescibacteria group bacterium]